MIYECNITNTATADKLKDALGKQGLTIDNGYWQGDVYCVETEATFDQTAFENEFSSYTDNDAKWEDIRIKRNQLLAETDFYALSDVTMTTEMSNYRQQLRDLPTSTSNPDDVVFPTKP
tara:strand:+ start:420 stop:776 length:357 start_codon:yes stop_codon:yes gene_type:complete